MENHCKTMQKYRQLSRIGYCLLSTATTLLSLRKTHCKHFARINNLLNTAIETTYGTIFVEIAAFPHYFHQKTTPIS